MGRKPGSPFGNVKTRKEMREALVHLMKDAGISDKIAETLNLDNKEDEKAICVGLMAAGYTGTEVAKAMGLPPSTLWTRYQKILGPGAKERQARRQESEARIEAAASAVSEGALAQMAQDIEEGGMRPGDVAKYAAASNKALERSRARVASGNEGDGDKWSQIFAKVAGEEGATIKVDIEPRKVIDVGGENRDHSDQ